MRGLAFAAALAVSVSAISTVSVKGSKMFTSDGNQWYMKGIAYQLTNDDPLAQPDQCKLDAALMKQLGANSIRVYHVDPTANHDSCMQTFADAGIYAWIDLDTFSTYILLDNQPPRWTQSLYDSYAKVMDAFHNYDNVAGFFVANELLTNPASSVAAPYIKAAARDMKAYRDNKGYRKFPVGYSAADVAPLRPMLQNYLACGDQSDAIDIYGLNAYEWCGDNTYVGSGYVELQKNASQYNIPIYFSETGCVVPRARLFQDQSAIFGSNMDGTWSGSIIYEWIEESNDYGLISYGPPASGAAATNSLVVDGFTRRGTPTPVLPDFTNLSKQWATLNPTGVKAADYTPSLSPVACPPFTSGAWLVDPSAPLPTIGQAYTGAGSASTGSASSTASSTGSSNDASSNTGSGFASTTPTGVALGANTASSASPSPSKTNAAVMVDADFRALAGVVAFLPFAALL